MIGHAGFDHRALRINMRGRDSRHLWRRRRECAVTMCRVLRGTASKRHSRKMQISVRRPLHFMHVGQRRVTSCIFR